jgi:DNA-binding NarL/FixJ family response regulator
MRDASDDPIILSLVDDMFFSSKIESTAKLVGVRAIQVFDPRQLEKALEGPPPRMIILDLGSKTCAPLEILRRIKADARFSRIAIVGFLSHVRHELGREAREAGCNQVMPRSAFAANLSIILESVKQPGSET